MKYIAIYGAGGFGREVKMLIDQVNEHNSQWDLVGYYDDGLLEGTSIHGVNINGGVEALNQLKTKCGLVIAIGDPKVKKQVIDKINNDNIYYPILIHPNVNLDKKQNIKIGEGTIITANNLLTVDIEIGAHVILNLACTVGHDAILKDYCSFMPAVNISGEVVIEEGVFMGTSSSIINRKRIGAWSVIGAGATVVKDIPGNCTAVGSPAKPLSKD